MKSSLESWKLGERNLPNRLLKKKSQTHYVYLEILWGYFIKGSVPGDVISGLYLRPADMLLFSISLAFKITATKLLSLTKAGTHLQGRLINIFTSLSLSGFCLR